MLHSEKKKTGKTVEFGVSPLSNCDLLESLAMDSLVCYMDTEWVTLISIVETHDRMNVWVLSPDVLSLDI
jgi:hypothetical protein